MLSIVGEKLFSTEEVMARIGIGKRTLLLYRTKKYVNPRMIKGGKGRPAPYYTEMEIKRIESIYRSNVEWMQREREQLLKWNYETSHKDS